MLSVGTRFERIEALTPSLLLERNLSVCVTVWRCWQGWCIIEKHCSGTVSWDHRVLNVSISGCSGELCCTLWPPLWSSEEINTKITDTSCPSFRSWQLLWIDPFLIKILISSCHRSHCDQRLQTWWRSQSRTAGEIFRSRIEQNALGRFSFREVLILLTT